MYTVLARKWRPQNFDQTFGQSHVLTTLKNAITMDRVAHAYLFSGPRGVGKTSISRILAKSLNCVEGPTITPCGECRHCVEIMQGHSLDVREIDGASNRRIDDIREVEDHVKFAPVDGKFKIYIIDEVHMLTKEAFNALLKTLEEPPAHIKFIFATTEDDKIPDTIRSRCQHFAFRRLSLNDIVANLQMILQAENISFDETVLFDVARAAEGSLRDAQSLLDQVISFCGEDLNHNDLELVLGMVGHKVLAEFVRAIVEENYVATLTRIQDLVHQGKDLYRFVVLLIQYVRDLIVLKVSGAEGDVLVDMTEQEIAEARDLISQLSLEKLLYMSQVLMKGEYAIKQAHFPRLPLEMCVIKMIQAGNMVSLKELLQASSVAPAASPSAAPVVSAVRPSSSAKPVVAATPRPTVSASPAVAGGASADQSGWGRLLAAAKAEKVTLHVALQKVARHELNDNRLVIAFNPEDDFSQQQVARSLPWIEEKCAQLLGCRVKASVESLAMASAVVQEAPSEVKEERSNREILQEPLVQNVLKSFEGRVTDVIKP